MSWSRRRRPRIRIPPRSPFLLLHSRRCVETASNKCWKRRKNGSTIRVGPPVRILRSRRAAEARCENRCNRRRTRWMDSLSPPVRVLQSKSSAEVPAANIGAKLVARTMPNRSSPHGRENQDLTRGPGDRFLPCNRILSTNLVHDLGGIRSIRHRGCFVKTCDFFFGDFEEDIPARRLGEFQNGPPGRGLSTPALSDETEHFPLPD